MHFRVFYLVQYHGKDKEKEKEKPNKRMPRMGNE